MIRSYQPHAISLKTNLERLGKLTEPLAGNAVEQAEATLGVERLVVLRLAQGVHHVDHALQDLKRLLETAGGDQQLRNVGRRVGRLQRELVTSPDDQSDLFLVIAGFTHSRNHPPRTATSSNAQQQAAKRPNLVGVGHAGGLKGLHAPEGSLQRFVARLLDLNVIPRQGVGVCRHVCLKAVL